MFPSKQDVRTHKSVRAKKQKHEASRPSVATPEELCEEILQRAVQIYRSGEKQLRFTVRVPSDSFMTWAKSQHLIGDEPLTFDSREIMHHHVVSRTRELVKAQLTEGVFLGNLTCQPSAPSSTALFDVQISVIHPHPHE